MAGSFAEGISVLNEKKERRQRKINEQGESRDSSSGAERPCDPYGESDQQPSRPKQQEKKRVAPAEDEEGKLVKEASAEDLDGA